MNIRSKKELIDYVNRGNKVKYIFFWGHKKDKYGISKSCFSQWYNSSFTVENTVYQTAEHYMMAEKARLFSENEMAKKIIEAKNAGMAKKLGRQIEGFDEKIWLNHRFDIVVKGNVLKFGQNLELRDYLLNTNNRILVEASPVDKIWGIGLASDNPNIENPNLWKGENILGFALMEARKKLL